MLRLVFPVTAQPAPYYVGHERLGKEQKHKKRRKGGDAREDPKRRCPRLPAVAAFVSSANPRLEGHIHDQSTDNLERLATTHAEQPGHSPVPVSDRKRR